MNGNFEEMFDALMKAAAEAMKPFLEKVHEHDLFLRPHPQQRALIAIGPKLTDEEQKELIDLLNQSSIQGTSLYYAIGPRKSTMDDVTEVINKHSGFHQSVIGMTPPEDGQIPEEFQIEIMGKEPDEATWTEIHDILAKDDFIKRWTVRVNGDVMFEKAPIQHKPRPVIEPKTQSLQREKVIQKDDVTDVKITLGKANTVEDVIEGLFGNDKEGNNRNR